SARSTKRTVSGGPLPASAEDMFTEESGTCYQTRRSSSAHGRAGLVRRSDGTVGAWSAPWAGTTTALFIRRHHAAPVSRGAGREHDMPPVHPALVHFPIALLIFAFGVDVLATVRDS